MHMPDLVSQMELFSYTIKILLRNVSCMKNKWFFVPMTIAMFFILPLLPASSQTTAAALQEGDNLWAGRQERKNVEEAINAYRKALATDPDNYEASWKIARAFFLLADMLDEIKENRVSHEALGREGMVYGKRAFELNPDGVEGHYYYGLCLAKYTLGISPLKALTQGIASKYEEHMGKAAEINNNYDSAGPLRALGRYWHQIPWPKRDMKKSIYYLEEAVQHAPNNIRGRYYLAEAYLKAKKKDLAETQLHIAVGLAVDPHEEISAVRWREKSELLLKETF